MHTLANQIQKLNVATDEVSSPKLVLSEGESKRNKKKLVVSVF